MESTDGRICENLYDKSEFPSQQEKDKCLNRATTNWSCTQN